MPDGQCALDDTVDRANTIKSFHVNEKPLKIAAVADTQNTTSCV